MSDQPERKHRHHVCAVNLDAATTRAIELALARAQQLIDRQQLVAAHEAMAMHGADMRTHETLFSVARAIAWETGGDLDAILCRLEAHYPHYAE